MVLLDIGSDLEDGTIYCRGLFDLNILFDAVGSMFFRVYVVVSFGAECRVDKKFEFVNLCGFRKLDFDMTQLPESSHLTRFHFL